MDRTDKIKERIAAVERRYHPTKSNERFGALFSLGWRVAIEWAVAVLFGYGLGYLLDHLLGSMPWGLVFCLLLGNIAGLLNIYKTYNAHQNTF